MSQINQHRAVTSGALAFSPEDASWFSMCSEERAWVMSCGDRPETQRPMGKLCFNAFFFPRKKRPDPVSVGP